MHSLLITKAPKNWVARRWRVCDIFAKVEVCKWQKRTRELSAVDDGDSLERPVHKAAVLSCPFLPVSIDLAPLTVEDACRSSLCKCDGELSRDCSIDALHENQRRLARGDVDGGGAASAADA